MKSVDVLVRCDALDDRSLLDMTRYGQLHQDSVHRPIRVESIDRREQLGLAHLFWKPHHGSAHAGRLAGVFLVAHVHLARRIFAYQDDRQSWNQARPRRQEGHVRRHLAADLLCQGSSIEDSCGHASFPRVLEQFSSGGSPAAAFRHLLIVSDPHVPRQTRAAGMVQSRHVAGNKSWIERLYDQWNRQRAACNRPKGASRPRKSGRRSTWDARASGEAIAGR